MKKFFTVAFFLLLAFGSKASHIAGISVSYAPLSDSSYKIVVFVFRDCSGIPFSDPTASVSWRSSCGGYQGTITCQRSPSFTGGGSTTGASVLQPDCPENIRILTTCNGGTDFGLERTAFEGIFIVPAALRNNPANRNCRFFTFGYSPACCRNTTVTTTAADAYVESWMNDTLTRKNASVIPTKFSIPAYCAGQPIKFNLGFVDPDLDSISTYLISAKSAANTNVTYTAPYTAQMPIRLLNGTTISIANSIMSLTPANVAQLGVFAFISEDWRFTGFDPTTGAPQYVLAGKTNVDFNYRFEYRPSYCDRVPPRFANNGSITPINVGCNTDSIGFLMSSSFRCSSVAPDGSDFRLVDPDGRIVAIKAAYPVNCLSNGGTPPIMLGKTIVVKFRRAFATNGIYTLYIKKGNDGNTLANRCGYFIDEMDSMKMLVTNCYEYKDPIAITNVTVDTSNNKDVVITWGDPSSAFDYSYFKNFNIYKKVGDKSPWSLVYKDAVPSNRSWRDVDFQVNSTVCYYAVGLEMTTGYQTQIRDSITNIVLRNDPIGKDDLSATFRWNPYSGWTSPTYNVEYSPTGASSSWSPFLPYATTTDTSVVEVMPVLPAKYAARIWTENGSVPGRRSYSNALFFDVPTRDLVPYTLVTPNGDGINDVFELEALTFWPNTEVTIMNRWGNVVYSTTNYKNDWGSGAAEGNYYYIIKDRNGKVKSGTLKVIK